MIRNTDIIHVGRDNTGSILIQRVLQQEYLFKADRNQRTHFQQEKRDNGRFQMRQLDMPDNLKASSAVDLGGFYQFQGNTGKRCQINNGSPAESLSQVADRVNRSECGRNGNQVDAFPSDSLDQIVNRPVVLQKKKNHRADNNR